MDSMKVQFLKCYCEGLGLVVIVVESKSVLTDPIGHNGQARRSVVSSESFVSAHWLTPDRTDH